MESTPVYAYVVLGACLVSVFAWVIVVAISLRELKPDLRYRGVGIKYCATATPWPIEQIEAVIDAAGEVAEREFQISADHVLFSDLMIWIYGPADLLRVPRAPDGTVVAHGKRVPLKGTMKMATVLGLAPTPTILIQQQAALSFGTVRDVLTTSMIHELMEHHLPKTLNGDENLAHAVKYRDLTNQVRAIVAKRLAETPKRFS